MNVIGLMNIFLIMIATYKVREDVVKAQDMSDDHADAHG